ncbi:MAG: MFS transporter, partial [Bacteroidales bacterium]|nr:MFS transporter [Bacteroidales bacterium]
MTPEKRISPWSWVPSLYFGEGLPYVAVMTISVILYKRFGMSNTDIAFYTAWLYLPWTIKFLWSPFVDIIKSKRWWIVLMQLLIGAFFGGVAFSLPTPFWIQASMAFFWLTAFSSATHDIAADGFYMHALETKQQAFFIGIRNTFYRLAMITGQGLIIILAGKLEQQTGNPFGMEQIPYAWMTVFLVMAVFFVLLGTYHAVVLPRPQSDSERKHLSHKQLLQELVQSIKSFFQKKHILTAIAFMLLYRFSEAQLVKIASPFLLDSAEAGGLGLNTAQVGFAYGTLGIASLVIGGIVGGIVISR